MESNCELIQTHTSRNSAAVTTATTATTTTAPTTTITTATTATTATPTSFTPSTSTINHWTTSVANSNSHPANNTTAAFGTARTVDANFSGCPLHASTKKAVDLSSKIRRNGRIHLVPLSEQDVFTWAQQRINDVGLTDRKTWSLDWKIYTPTQSIGEKLTIISRSDDPQDMFAATSPDTITRLSNEFQTVLNAMSQAYRLSLQLKVEGFTVKYATVNIWIGLLSVNANTRYLYIEIDFKGTLASCDEFCDAFLGVKFERTKDYQYDVAIDEIGEHVLTSPSWQAQFKALMESFQEANLI